MIAVRIVKSAWAPAGSDVLESRNVTAPQDSVEPTDAQKRLVVKPVDQQLPAEE